MCNQSLAWRLAAIATILLGNLSATVLAADDIASSPAARGGTTVEIGAGGLESAAPCISVERELRAGFSVHCELDAVAPLVVVLINRSVLDKDRTCSQERDNRPRILRIDRPLLLI